MRNNNPWLGGLRNLMGSTKGALCLITLLGMFALVAADKLDSAGVVAISALVPAIYCYTRAKTDIATKQD